VVDAGFEQLVDLLDDGLSVGQIGHEDGAARVALSVLADLLDEGALDMA